MTPRLTILFVSLGLFSLSSAFAQQEIFPFLAQVTTDSVNVRAGQSANFETLCQLSRGEDVVVVGRSYKWYEIQLPLNARAFISDKYVTLLSGGEGEINAGGVNVRAGTSIQSTIVGQLDKGSRVRILGKQEGWYRIEPSPSIHGWVADQFLAFKSRDVGIEKREAAPLPAQPFSEQKQEAVNVLPVVPAHKKIVSATGYLRPCRNSDKTAAASYELVIDNQPAYDVRGVQHILDEFAYATVTIEGTIPRPDDAPGRSLNPVIIVSKIQLVL
jgi:uncharacterized protein YraI